MAVTAVSLAAYRSSVPPPSARACKTALAAQLAASENGSQAAKNAPLPKQCGGLAPSVVSGISGQVVKSALASYLKEQGQRASAPPVPRLAGPSRH
jgi:hypothetical protein